MYRINKYKLGTGKYSETRAPKQAITRTLVHVHRLTDWNGLYGPDRLDALLIFRYELHQVLVWRRRREGPLG